MAAGIICSGSRPLQIAADLGRTGILARSRLKVSNQPPLAAGVLPRHQNTLPDRGMFSERCIDFSELDAKSANLNLMIAPSQVFNISIR